jgi:hypothetical protein
MSSLSSSESKINSLSSTTQAASISSTNSNSSNVKILSNFNLINGNKLIPIISSPKKVVSNIDDNNNSGSVITSSIHSSQTTSINKPWNLSTNPMLVTANKLFNMSNDKSTSQSTKDTSRNSSPHHQISILNLPHSNSSNSTSSASPSSSFISSLIQKPNPDAYKNTSSTIVKSSPCKLNLVHSFNKTIKSFNNNNLQSHSAQTDQLNHVLFQQLPLSNNIKMIKIPKIATLAESNQPNMAHNQQTNSNLELNRTPSSPFKSSNAELYQKDCSLHHSTSSQKHSEKRHLNDERDKKRKAKRKKSARSRSSSSSSSMTSGKRSSTSTASNSLSDDLIKQNKKHLSKDEISTNANQDEENIHDSKQSVELKANKKNKISKHKKEKKKIKSDNVFKQKSNKKKEKNEKSIRNDEKTKSRVKNKSKLMQSKENRLKKSKSKSLPSHSNHKQSHDKALPAINQASTKLDSSFHTQDIKQEIDLICETNKYDSDQQSKLTAQSSFIESFQIADDELQLFDSLITQEIDPNGGASLLVAYQDEIDEKLQADDSKRKFAKYFLNLVYSESKVERDEENTSSKLMKENDLLFSSSSANNILKRDSVANHVLGVIRNSAKSIPDLINYFADNYPQMTVKSSLLLNNKEINTLKISDYRKCVNSTYLNGTFRYGPLLQTSIVGVRNEEIGDYFPEFIDNYLHSNAFLNQVMPWGEMSLNHQMNPMNSDDGPIIWARPGEQMIPTSHLKDQQSVNLNNASCEANSPNSNEKKKK